MPRQPSSPFNTTARGKANANKPLCADGTLAHHIVFESPESQTGGIVAGACLHCPYTTTGISSWRMDFEAAQTAAMDRKNKKQEAGK